MDVVAGPVGLGVHRLERADRYAAMFVEGDTGAPIGGRRWQAAAASPWSLAALAGVPLVVALIVLAGRTWAPTLDMAMTELRVRDVGGRHTPLIGLPGRIGTFPDDQGSHPGPISFYLLAPFYRVAGSSSWGLELGTVVVNLAAIAGIVLLGARLAGRRGAIVLAAVVAVAVRGYGLSVLTHPWNPYLPVLVWLLVLVSAWAVLAGHHRAIVLVVAAGSVAAQTHVPYLANGLAVVGVLYVVMIVRWFRADWSQFERREGVTGPIGLSLLVGAVLWVPPVIDQFRNDPGNIRRLYRHFATDPPEPAIGLSSAVRVFFRHLDAFGATRDLVMRDDAFVHRSGLERGSVVGGIIVLVLWLGAVGVGSWRRDRRLNALNAVVAIALVAGAVSISRIFGKVWFYLTLWAWSAMLLAVLAIGWALVLAARDIRSDAPARERDLRLAVWPAVAIGAVATVGSLVAAADLEVPEPQLSDGLHAVLADTSAAIDRGEGAATGPGGTYLVYWKDAAYNGSQGYGLLNELERREYDVGVLRPWRFPATHHRVLAPGSYDAEIHFVSGRYIEEWDARPGFVEVASFDRRTAAERARFDDLRDRVRDRLAEIGRADVDPMVDDNLFGASLDPDLPRDVVDDLSEMLLLSVPVAVFIAPAGSTE